MNEYWKKTVEEEINFAKEISSEFQVSFTMALTIANNARLKSLLEEFENISEKV